jgi:hypothetical protein
MSFCYALEPTMNFSRSFRQGTRPSWWHAVAMGQLITPPTPAEPKRPPQPDPQPYQDPVKEPPHDPPNERPLIDPVPPDRDLPRM